MNEQVRAVVEWWLPYSGPCLICGCKTLGLRHRIVDAIHERGKRESIQALAADYDLPAGVIRYIVTSKLKNLYWLRKVRKEK